MDQIRHVRVPHVRDHDHHDRRLFLYDPLYHDHVHRDHVLSLFCHDRDHRDRLLFWHGHHDHIICEHGHVLQKYFFL